MNKDDCPVHHFSITKAWVSQHFCFTFFSSASQTLPLYGNYFQILSILSGCTLSVFAVSLPLPHLLLTHALSSLKPSWKQPYAKKRKKKKCEREVSNSIYFSGISPLPFFHISGCFYPETVVWTASGRWEPHGLFTQGIHKANFSLMKPIVLDSFS